MAGRKRAAIILNDDEQFDRAALIRLAVWGASAIIVLGAAIWAGHAEPGAKRTASAVPSEPPEALTQFERRTDDLERDIRQMSDALRILMADRERLALRVSMVERSLGDLTGSLSRDAPPGANGKAAADAKPQAETKASEPKALETKPAAEPRSTAEPSPQANAMVPAVTKPAAPAPTPAPSSLSSAEASATAVVEPASKTSAPAAPAPVALAKPPAAAAALPAAATAVPVTAAVPASPPVSAAAPAPAPSPAAETPKASPETTAQSPPTPGSPSVDATPIPRPREVAAVASRSAIQDDIAPPTGIGGGSGATTGIGDYGVDLGPALTLNRLRTRWKSLKTVYGTLFDGLRPVVAIRENHEGWPLELHLIVGPFPAAAAAQQFCAAIARTQYSCQATAFDGQRLALR